MTGNVRNAQSLCVVPALRWCSTSSATPAASGKPEDRPALWPTTPHPRKARRPPLLPPRLDYSLCCTHAISAWSVKPDIHTCYQHCKGCERLRQDYGRSTAGLRQVCGRSTADLRQVCGLTTTAMDEASTPPPPSFRPLCCNFPHRHCSSSSYCSSLPSLSHDIKHITEF